MKSEGFKTAGPPNPSKDVDTEDIKVTGNFVLDFMRRGRKKPDRSGPSVKDPDGGAET